MASVLSLFSCSSFDVKEITPHFIDPVRGTTRSYHVVQTEPEIVFEFTKEQSIKDAVDESEGLVALPVPQFLKIKRAYESYYNKKHNNVEIDSDDYLNVLKEPSSIKKEIKVLSGLKLWKN